METDTITAIATPAGKGAISVIRVSGDRAFTTVEDFFDGKKAVQDMKPNSTAVGLFKPDKSQSAFIDQVILTKYVKPRSYTGEDLIEISCHGSVYIVQEILNLLLSGGIRLAEAGEFTKRAFLNGKMDLTQAESVADIINAQTQKSLEYAQAQANGSLYSDLAAIREILKKHLIMLEIELDFSDEDVEKQDRSQIMEGLNRLEEEMNRLVSTFHFGKLIREGMHLVLTGKPNVGKSSILTRFLNEDRAIVSEIPGTTRDTIEESLTIDGYLFKISDTAGLRSSQDRLEISGVERTKKQIQMADFILFVIDGHKKLTVEDYESLSAVRQLSRHKKALLINKADLKSADIDPDFKTSFDRCVAVSARTGMGFEALRKLLVEEIENDQVQHSAVINRVRHLDVLKRTQQYIDHARESLTRGFSAEFIAFDIRAASIPSEN